ncbi:MAG: carboxypeptidase-like regulatory domain-containing protein [Bacteroidales bacterium]|nr:carboxypeptidase-like regulatory domain-containing protein [Bacteroidales bacterium]
MTIKSKDWFLLSGAKRNFFPAIKLTFVLLMLAAFTLTVVSAVPSADLQQRTVTGVILDNVGQPLAAASVIEKGTTNGQLAGPDGSYSINVASGNSVLIFSFIATPVRR